MNRGASSAQIIDLAAARAMRERERLAAFERELKRRLCAFLDAAPPAGPHPA
jgi:hypothetical protein